MLTQQHFRLMADEIRKIRDVQQRAERATWCAHIFKRDNPKFNYERFYTACNIDPYNVA